MDSLILKVTNSMMITIFEIPIMRIIIPTMKDYIIPIMRNSRCNGHEFEKAPGVGKGQGSLACCRPWGRTQLSG